MLFLLVQHGPTDRIDSKAVTVCRATGVSLFESLKLDAL